MFGIISILIAGVLTVSCTKTFDEKIVSQTDLSNNSVAQVFNAMVNTNRNYLYIDGKIINGGAPMTPGSLFPATGSGINVPGGDRSFLVRDTLTATTQLPLSFAQSLKASKRYTLFMYDTITTPKQKTVETDIIVPADTSARIRLANFVYSSSAVSAIDIYSANKKANIFTNIQTTDVTNYIPYPSGIADTLYVRLTGTGVDLMNITPPTPLPGNIPTPIRFIITPAARRSYTFVFRGSYLTSLTNAAQVRTLSAFANN
jgi:hypothetical protein